MKLYGETRIHYIAKILGRDSKDAFEKWLEIESNKTSERRAWTREEDNQLSKLVAQFAEEDKNKWMCIEKQIAGRNRKQCRDRWCHVLNPKLAKKGWTAEEDALIIEMQSNCGNRWSEIAFNLPGRSNNCVKNRYYNAL